jgi:MutS domain V/MutS domain III
MSGARELYAQRLAERERLAASLRARERNLSIIRLLSAFAAIAIVFFSIRIALIPLAAFIALIVIHDRVIRARKRAEASAAFFARGVARAEGTWPGKGDAGAEFAEDHHPYAADLDLFGKGSLFELISLAVTSSGRARLASWLKAPAMDARAIAARQAAVLELRDNIHLREDLAVGTAEVVHELEAAKLDAWASREPATIAAPERILALAVPAIVVVLLLLSLPAIVARIVGMTHPEAVGRFGAIADFPLWPLGIAIIAVALLARHFGPRVEPIIMAVERAEPALALLAGILARLERETFTSERLARISERIRGNGSSGSSEFLGVPRAAQQPLSSEELRGTEGPRGTATVASREIDRLRKRVALLDARRNQFFAPFGLLLLWTANVSFAIERWRAEHGRAILEWIDSVAELEALSSLASFAFEHPSFAMPQVVDGPPQFDARALGHPLIPDDRRVTNDLRLGGKPRLLIISGSNMSGKSTMMRSAGVAAVLALAGGPVCAASLRITPMNVGASIRIHDSLQENASRFYAEILRIRQILELARTGPLLFLLDEVLAGTNSHDRRIGAEGIVRALVAGNAIGLLSTHDLALASIAEDASVNAANVHFEDHLEEGRVVFDYRMRPGVVTKSNALALMRSVGIQV